MTFPSNIFWSYVKIRYFCLAILPSFYIIPTRFKNYWIILSFYEGETYLMFSLYLWAILRDSNEETTVIDLLTYSGLHSYEGVTSAISILCRESNSVSELLIFYWSKNSEISSPLSVVTSIKSLSSLGFSSSNPFNLNNLVRYLLIYSISRICPWRYFISRWVFKLLKSFLLPNDEQEPLLFWLFKLFRDLTLFNERYSFFYRSSHVISRLLFIDFADFIFLPLKPCLSIKNLPSSCNPVNTITFFVDFFSLSFSFTFSFYIYPKLVDFFRLFFFKSKLPILFFFVFSYFINLLDFRFALSFQTRLILDATLLLFSLCGET